MARRTKNKVIPTFLCNWNGSSRKVECSEGSGNDSIHQLEISKYNTANALSQWQNRIALDNATDSPADSEFVLFIKILQPNS